MCRSSGETLDKESFYRHRAAIYDVLYPKKKPYILSSEGLIPSDNVQLELALREHANRIGIIGVCALLSYIINNDAGTNNKIELS